MFLSVRISKVMYFMGLPGIVEFGVGDVVFETHLSHNQNPGR